MWRHKDRRGRRGVRLLLEQLEHRTQPSAYAASTVAQLIEALSLANANSGVANTIVLTAPPNTPYVLDAALPAVAAANNLTIVGNGDTIERSADAGTPAFRLFDVEAGASLTFQGLTLENGLASTGEGGGAILNEGTLTVEDCAISGNSADSGSNLGGGGGIANVGGTVSVVNSTIANNSTPEFGGGIFNSGGTAMLANCTVSGNYAGISGGGIEAQGNVTVTCSTFSLNSATYGGAIDNYYGLYQVTIADSILAGDWATYAPEVQNALASLGYNLVGETDGGSGWVSSDLTGTSAAPLNPLLAALGNYGGPTETMALLPDSPAIGAADPNYMTDTVNPLANDQRGSGFARVVNGRLDIGAFELQLPAAFAVIGFPAAVNAGDTDTVTVTALDADGSIDTSYGGTVQITSSDPQAVLPSNAGLTNGVGQFQVTLRTAGTQSITATDTVYGAVTGTESGIAVAPITFALSGFPTAVNAGDTDTVTVTALDADGSIDTSYGGTVQITSSDPQAVLPDGAGLTNGTGQFQVTLTTAGTQSITATDTVYGAVTDTESNIAVAPLAFSRLAFLTSPTDYTATAGQPLGTVKVAITDAFGNIDTGDSDGTLSLTVSGPGRFDSHSLITADVVNGTATFQDLVLDMAGSYTLGVSSPGLEAVTSGPFTVYPGPVTSLSFVLAPKGSTAGQPLAPIQVVLMDEFGSIEAGDYSDIVDLTFSGPQGFTIESTVSGGVATFSALVLYGAGSYTLSASMVSQAFDYFANGIPGGMAGPFTVAPGVPARLTFTHAPAGGTAGQPLGPVQVSLTDDFGNVEATTAGSVSLSVSGPDGFAPGSITTADLVNGVATVGKLTLTTAGYYTLAASSPDVSQPDSVSLTITPMLATGATLSTATPLFFTPAGTVQASGYLADADQFHIYSVALSVNDEIDVTASGRAAGSGLSPLLRIFTAGGTQVALNDQERGDPELKFQAATAGTYFIGVSCGPDGNYDPTRADSGSPGTTTGLYVLSIRLTPGAVPQADVEAASIRLGTGTAVWGDSLSVTFSVENRGAADAGPFSVSVLIGSDQDVWDGPPLEPSPRQDLQDFLVPGLPAGQAFSPGIFTVTLPDAATAAADGLPTSGPMFLEVQIVPNGGTPQTEPLAGTDRVHLGEDWEKFTILTPQVASGDNMSFATADTLQDIDSQVSGSVAFGTEEWFQLSAPEGTLTATVAAAGSAGSAPRLTLYAQDGTPLVSSDRQIVEHLDVGIYGSHSGTYHLGVAAQGDGGAYQLITQVVPGSSPLVPILPQSSRGEEGAVNGVLLADVSGDGRPDLIARTNDGLEVLPGNGDGTFGAPLTDDTGHSLGIDPAAVVAVADLYGNGRLDVIAADGSIVVLPADSDGGFLPGTTVASTGKTPLALATADLTGDGFPDMITLDTDGTMTVVLNNGDGIFQAPQQIDSGASAVGFGQVLRDFAVADLTANGIPDLIVPDADGTVHVLLGNGDGTFQSPLIVPVGSDIGALTVADVNGDGRPDLVVTTSDPNGAAAVVRVLLGNGDGIFRPGPLLAPHDVDGSFDWLAAADLNGDGHLDLLVAGSGTGVVFPGTADGRFGAAIPLAVVPGETSAALAELNGDGRLDLVVGNDDGTIAVLPGNDDGTFQVPSPTLGADLKLQSQDMVDVTGDGHPDVVATGNLGVILEVGNGDGTFQPARLLALGQTLVAVTDLNGDGRPDLVLNDGIMLGNGNGTFQPLEPLPAGQTALAVGDFTGDGIPDLIVPDAAGDLSFRRGNGDGTFQPAQPIEGVTGVTEAITAVLTGDGHLDLVVVTSVATDKWWDPYTMTVLLGNGDGTFRLGFTQPNDEPNPSLLAVALHDGQPPDLLFSADFGQFEFVLDNDGAGNFSLDGDNSFENEWSDTSAVAVADFTGNGHQDVVFLDSEGGVWLAMGDGNGALLDPQGNGALSDLQEVADDPNANSLAVADVNGDGRPDIILNDEVLLGNGDGTFRQAAPTGGITVQDTPHLADLTGDGLADSVVLDGSGNILFRKGLPGGSVAPPVILNPGHPAVDLTIVNTGTGLAVAAAEATCDPTALSAHQWLYDVALYTVAADGTVTRTIAFSSPLLPTRIAAGDLTGSGLGDLIVADALDYSVTIAFQTAPGQFGSVISRSVGCAPSNIALVDVSGDGLPDIVVTDQGCDEVTVLLNDASHSFTTEASYRAGTAASAVFPFATQATYQAGTAASSSIVYALGQAVSLAAGDFTGDGRTDLVVVNRAAHSFSLLVNDGNDGFVDPQTTLTTSTSDGLTVNEQPGALVAGYFSGPGQPLDLAILMQDAGQVWIYTGDGQGHFMHTASIFADDSPTGLSLVPDSGPGMYDLLVGNSYGDVLRLVGNGHGSFSPPPPATGNRVALDVTHQANGQLEALVADAPTNQVTVQSPAASGARFVPVQVLTAADPADQLAPGAVQWAKLDRNSPYYDAVVLGSASNDVLVYRCTGFDAAGQPTFAAPVAYPVGTDPVAVTIQDITGNGIPDMLVANYGSNDVSILFGSYGASGDWVAREGPRLKSGGSGPVAVAVQDLPGGNPSLIITNGQSGNLTVLPGVGQGFFNDTDPQILNIPGNPAIGAALLLGSSGVVVTDDGRLVGFNLDDFARTVATIFAPPPGEGVAAVAALADGDLLAVREDGTVVLLAVSSGSGLQPVQTLAPLTGIPSDPSALAVLENESDVEVLVTSAGQDQLFVFGLPAGLTLPVLTPGAPVAVAEVPSEAPLALVVTLEGGVLPGGEAMLPAGLLVGAAPAGGEATLAAGLLVGAAPAGDEATLPAEGETTLAAGMLVSAAPAGGEATLAAGVLMGPASVGGEVIPEGAGRLNIIAHAVLALPVDNGGHEPLLVGSSQDEPLTVPVREKESDYGLGIDELLRRIDLYGSPDQLPPKRATPPAMPRDGDGKGEGGEAAAPEAPAEPTQHAVADTVKDAVWLDWPALAASRPRQDHVGPEAGPVTLWGEALLVVASVTGPAPWAKRRSERSRRTS